MDANNLTCHDTPWHSKEIRYMRLARIYFFLTCRKRHSKVIRNIMYFMPPFFFLKESFIFYVFFMQRATHMHPHAHAKSARSRRRLFFFCIFASRKNREKYFKSLIHNKNH